MRTIVKSQHNVPDDPGQAAPGSRIRRIQAGGSGHSQNHQYPDHAATNRDLQDLVQEGNFRNDLYYRLNIFPLTLPPLRERRDDIPKLAYHFLRHYCRKTGKRIQGFTDDALETLTRFDWPGNVRQLKNAVERLVILSDEEIVYFLNLMGHLAAGKPSREQPIPDTQEQLQAQKQRLLAEQFHPLQKAFLQKALKAASGNIAKAALRTGMKRPNFYALMRKHGLRASDFRNEHPGKQLSG